MIKTEAEELQGSVMPFCFVRQNHFHVLSYLYSNDQKICSDWYSPLLLGQCNAELNANLGEKYY